VATILLVEDDEHVREILVQIIGLAGHDARAAATYGDGERAWSTGQFDLLIADICLPDGSGYRLAENAARAGRKAVLITGASDRTFGQPDSPVGSCLVKPFRMGTLVDAINDTLQLHARP
jgi:DNA-binding NtrC family response regulator